MRLRFVPIAVLCLAGLPAQSVAQEVTGVPGSPGATTTISGKQLPAPDPPFGGVIKDDFGVPSTFGG